MAESEVQALRRALTDRAHRALAEVGIKIRLADIEGRTWGDAIDAKVAKLRQVADTAEVAMNNWRATF